MESHWKCMEIYVYSRVGTMYKARLQRTADMKECRNQPQQAGKTATNQSEGKAQPITARRQDGNQLQPEGKAATNQPEGKAATNHNQKARRQLITVRWQGVNQPQK